MKRNGFFFFWSAFLLVFWGGPSPLLSQEAGAPRNILIDNFENASMKNFLGGYIGSDIKSPGVCRFCFTWRQQDTFGKATHSIKIDYDVRSKGSYTYLWMHLGPEGPGGKIQTQNLTGYSYLSFWVKAPRRGENFKIELHCDTNESGRYDPGEDASGSVYVDAYVGSDGLRDQWRKVVIPLSDFKDIKDLSRAMEIVIVFENLRGNRQGTILMDEVMLGTKKYRAVEGPVVMPAPTTLVPSKAIPVGGYNFLPAGTVQLLTARGIPSEYLEGTGFEVSWDEGRSWYLVGIDYDLSKECASVPWRIPILPPSQKVLVHTFSQGTGGQRVMDYKGLEIQLQTCSDADLIDRLTREAFQYFVDNQDPETGLFLDAVGGNASTAVAGFGLAAMVIGAQEGWIEKEEARSRALKTLRTYERMQEMEKEQELKNKQTSLAGKIKARVLCAVLPEKCKIIPSAKDGLFYHFVKPNSGRRVGDCEISVVDTALLMLGVLTAGEYFGGDIQGTARRVYDNAQWNKFYDERTRCFSMGWAPEKGYFSTQWDYYTDEALLLQILAAGSRTSRVQGESFYAFLREKGHVRDGDDYIYSWSGALFTHQYVPAWLDLRGMQDKTAWDWWENSRRAVRANRDYCWYHKEKPYAYGPHRWGISSCDRPEGYVMHFGIMPNGSGQEQEDGTISPISCASSILFAPAEALADLKYQLTAYPFLWGPYGLRNSYNAQRNWFSNVDFGLDTGLLLLSLENYRNGLIWKTLHKSSVIQDGLKACGLTKQAKGQVSSRPLIHREAAALPPVSKEAPASLCKAQERMQEMEDLCARDDIDSFARYLKHSPKAYGEILETCQALAQTPPVVRIHCEWLKALIAARQTSGTLTRRHFWKMLQMGQDLPGDASSRLSFMRRYMDYIFTADLRDFEEGIYAAFLKEAQQNASVGVQALEDFAQLCRQIRRFSAASRAWMDALAMRRKRETGDWIANYALQIAEGFFAEGRVDEAMAFDQIFLEQVRINPQLMQGDAGLVKRLLDLGQQYHDAQCLQFARACFLTLHALPPNEYREEILYRLAKVEEACSKHAKAIEYYGMLLKERPNGYLAPYARLAIPINRLFLDQSFKAFQKLKSFVKKNPKSPLRDDALLSLGIACYKTKDYKMAKRYLLSIPAKNEELFKKARNYLLILEGMSNR